MANVRLRRVWKHYKQCKNDYERVFCFVVRAKIVLESAEEMPAAVIEIIEGDEEITPNR
ncbi:MAG: hypothetical protein IPK58_21970 [Acidobacteria bacterium]|nr:hypothetical protein [Acidobacteriota bacterium]